MKQILPQNIQLKEAPMLAVETTSTLPIIPSEVILERCSRFEEALFVIADKKKYLILGNECSNLASLSPLEAKVIHCPQFSLPNPKTRDLTYVKFMWYLYTVF